MKNKLLILKKLLTKKLNYLEAKTLEDLKTAVKEVTDSIRKAPKMESDIQKIEDQAKEIAKSVEYSEA